MLIFLLAYLGGVLTILSPCILPVLPFVFARSDRPFVQSGLPLLLGMALTFAGVATLAAVAGGWAVAANEYGRIFAMLLLAVFGVTLLFPALSDRLTRPLVALGERLTLSANGGNATVLGGVLSSLLLGVATGLLWAPCAGPILGLILTGAALEGANTTTTLLLLAYAAGAATSLALALLIGGRVFAFLKRSLGVGEWVRRGLGVLVLVAVVAIGLGVDTGFLTQVSLSGTNSVEQALLDGLQPQSTEDAGGGAATPTPPMTQAPALATASTPAETLPVEGAMPSIDGAVQWLNSAPLTAAELKGKVVLVDFWTYSCINCLRSIPYVRAWAEKYKDKGLVVIGVHAPEFAFEKSIPNVEKAIADLGITYPVAVDNNYAIWRAFQNRYWPAHYFIDAKGNVRHHHFGEGDYDGSERVIQQLLAEAGNTAVPDDIVQVSATGAEAASNYADVKSPETYIGYSRAANFVAQGGAVKDASAVYAGNVAKLNDWTLAGKWTVHAENATLDVPNGRITYRFHARDLHLVLGPGADGKPIHFRVTIDGSSPGASAGVDVDKDGNGKVTEERLYQLIRQSGGLADHTFEITFFDAGVMAYSFTFG